MGAGESGRYAVGTVDSYLIARMTRGTWHVTDVSNACRTLLFDLEAGDWSDELCELFGVPRDALPDLVPNWGEVAPTDPSVFLGLSLPIAGIAGDQQSALFGQTCFDEGESKCTYGTGSFILTNTGSSVVRSDAGLLSTAAWRSPDGEMTYALEGAIFVTGSAVQWLRDGLQIVGNAAETAAIAQTVDDSDGVVFVPALTGLGAPHWDPHARGMIIGITRGTTRAHIVRATLEAIAFEVRDVLETLPELKTLRVDGGASANDLLCQMQADQVGRAVERPEIVETTALGAAFLAGLGTGVWELRRRPPGDVGARPAVRARRRPRRARRVRTPAGATRSSGRRAGPASSSEPLARRLAPPRRLALRLVDGLLRLGLHRLGLAELVVDLLDLGLERGDPAAELVDLRLELQRLRAELLHGPPRRPVLLLGLARARPGPRPAARRRPCAPSRRRRDRVRRVSWGRCVGSGAAAGRAVALKPSASGSATAPLRSRSPSPVAASDVTSSPLRTAFAASGSSIAAVRVASIWSPTDSVVFTPSSRAIRRAAVVTDAVSWRRCLVNSRSWVASRFSWASRSAAPTASTWSTWSGSRRTSRLSTHAASDALRSPLMPAASALSALCSLARASRAGVKSASGRA